MAEEEVKEPTAEEAPKEGEQAKPALKSKKKFIIIAGILLLLLIIGGGAAYWFLIKPKSHKEDASQASSEEHTENSAKKETKAKPEEPAFLDFDPFIVNLESGDKHPSFLKATVTLQLPSKEVAPKIQAKMPIIQDSFQTYLRELRADDLVGSAGIYRLREELLLRINKVMFPEKVTDILFKEFLVQ